MRRHSAICERYDVVVVPFPFHEIPVRKRRPVVVLSGDKFNRANGWTVVAMVTTAKETSWPSDVLIKGLQAAGLMVPCVVRPRFQTMPNEIIVRRLGALDGMDRLAFERQLAEMLL
jgi:mRNA interferase MazF